MIIIVCGTATSVALEYLKERFSVNSNKLLVKSKLLDKMIDSKIESKECSLFVLIVEKNINDDKIIMNVIDYYLSAYKNYRTIVLCCTHYPFLEKYLEKYFKNANFINLNKITSYNFDKVNNNKSKINLYFSDLNDITRDFVKKLYE